LAASWPVALERVQDPERDRSEQLYCSEFHVGVSLCATMAQANHRLGVLLRCVKRLTMR